MCIKAVEGTTKYCNFGRYDSPYSTRQVQPGGHAEEGMTELNIEVDDLLRSQKRDHAYQKHREF